MKKLVLSALFVLSPILTSQVAAVAGDDAKDALQGVWQAKSLEASGKAAPDDAVKLMKFTFKGDKLFVQGNLKDGKEEEHSYTIDADRSPKQLEFTRSEGSPKPILGIYELKGDE